MKVIALGAASEKAVQELKLNPAYRKATDTMLWALASSTGALKDIRSKIKSIVLVLSSSHGELETTKEFLFQLDQNKSARPFLFQNSLHNATTGFLSIQLGIQEASITVSQGKDSLEKGIEVAETLLGTSRPLCALVVHVEGAVKDFPGFLTSHSEARVIANQKAIETYGL